MHNFRCRETSIWTGSPAVLLPSRMGVVQLICAVVTGSAIVVPGAGRWPGEQTARRTLPDEATDTATPPSPATLSRSANQSQRDASGDNRLEPAIAPAAGDVSVHNMRASRPLEGSIRFLPFRAIWRRRRRSKTTFTIAGYAFIVGNRPLSGNNILSGVVDLLTQKSTRLLSAP